MPVPEREGIGIAFDCPCGACGSPVFVNVTPRDGRPYDTGGAPEWERTGEDFATMTLSPSIRRMDGCKWHGYVRNGKVTGWLE